jgi:hypothetical protein
MIKKINLILLKDKIGNLSLPIFVCLVLFFTYFVIFPLMVLFEDGMTAASAMQDKSILRAISACLFAPVLETLCFQLLPIQILDEGLKIKNKIVQILVSSCIFGLLHFQSIYYIMAAFSIGIVLATGFIIRKDCKNIKNAFIAISIVHAIRNLIAVFSWYF